MDIRKVKKLIELLEESNISEIEIQEGEESVRISRHPNGASWQPQPMPQYAQQPGYAPAPPAAGAPASAPAAEAEPQGASYRGEAVNSPMVGTFYRSPAPGAKSFVEVGDSVKQGDTVCIIEAMKMMNQIEADRDGVVEAILVEDGEPVEFDQPMIVIA
ncbi:acetyl-CoA carboxylase biotin carboxyl carrier protein [Halomonas sp. ATBC28]|jgi:acetyl-CoA carboxylase biotin carboxyl carrier protein|uniref:Biotin carboxyl carrier protein of acetyl-CoA carboxylase n=1 Tax=Vreelandella titanicae TaxID=664683 RepID=A0A6N0YVE3_9GAMM|nr:MULTISPECIES: acetyl-CoA carboxylase biotin carboxyl carrier protein [Halomonas]KIN14930.1 acetyl-CoA carboxylase [Halomonas sp. KHS3]MCD1587297.1 acetyl-CoA carboxylase biotin carboxyl carrier protein [Halomonas sp. IOP_14]MCE7517409.1 acetyl-CoA carboxylase biotin carboxyl carrier protein [Halomonas titanicae]NVE89783.1 acetyl-CoA carboxylase biotin carboxyl carrier protein [Halomonas titanicae]QKS23308.1 Biotin carboxyl carrier protein of acetyl-CoA carboxylase [Halomonas titanicae]|tara:strand:- start:209 stop:685 length:477 start_codon:yes stop_codon:yes gene_type:complete